MENRTLIRRLLTGFSLTLLLVATPLALAASAEAATGEIKERPGPEVERDLIDKPDFACGERCSVDLCVTDAQTSAYHWCGLSAMGDSCDGGYDPSLCTGESGF